MSRFDFDDEAGGDVTILSTVGRELIGGGFVSTHEHEYPQCNTLEFNVTKQLSSDKSIILGCLQIPLSRVTANGEFTERILHFVGYVWLVWHAPNVLAKAPPIAAFHSHSALLHDEPGAQSVLPTLTPTLT